MVSGTKARKMSDENQIKIGFLQKGWTVRWFRRFLVICSLALLLLLAVGAGGVASALYVFFGSGKSITAQGPSINLGEGQSCLVVVIDLDRIDISGTDQLGLLPRPTEKLVISTVPTGDLFAGLLPRDVVDSTILGFDTCLASLESGSWVLTHSAPGQPWLDVGERTGFTTSSTGSTVAFDMDTATKSTMIIGLTDPKTNVAFITLDADLGYPNADSWALGAGIAAGLLLMVFVVLVVIVRVRNTQRSSP